MKLNCQYIIYFISVFNIKMLIIIMKSMNIVRCGTKKHVWCIDYTETHEIYYIVIAAKIEL